MNKCVVELFSDTERIKKFLNGLPLAFELAQLEFPKGNPAVGLFREHVIVGFFKYELGGDKVKATQSGTQRGFDVQICGKPLSIKTITGSGQIKVLWTVDPLQIGKEIASGYKPAYDILLVMIYWGRERESVFYIPLEAQRKVYDALGGKDYLHAAVGQNHRGVSLSKLAKNKLISDEGTCKHRINWEKQKISHNPYERWESFWKRQK